MVPGNFTIVTILVVIYFTIPVLYNSYKTKLFSSLTFLSLIKVLNKSLNIQGIIFLLVFPLSWVFNHFSFALDAELTGSAYTYFIIGVFMYLPCLGFLNFIKLIILGKREK